jgi:serine protease Do
LGVLVDAVPFATLERLGLAYGVAVRAVMPRSPAAQGGVQPGDVITALDGSLVYSPERLQWLVQHVGDARGVTLEVLRGTEALSLEIPLARPTLRSPARPPGPMRLAPGLQRSYLGIQMQPLTDDLRRLFGAPPGVGVIVAQVVKDSPAEQAGLAAGDVLVQMDRKAIRGVADVYRALAYFEPGDALDLVLIRDKQRQALSVTLGERAAPSLPPGVPGQDRLMPDEDWDRDWWQRPPGAWPPGVEELPQRPAAPSAPPERPQQRIEGNGLAL